MPEQIFLFDNFALHAAQAFSSPLLDTAMKGITLLGNPAFWILIAAFFTGRAGRKILFT